ncbi:hypothetical protein ASE01_19510 [Nocardioides sp. Root190]|nr:hypothetical protein ASE01_19510 [Nocardioides sp. Root190]
MLVITRACAAVTWPVRRPAATVVRISSAFASRASARERAGSVLVAWESQAAASRAPDSWPMPSAAARTRSRSSVSWASA